MNAELLSNNQKITIDRMTVSDLDAVIEIEKKSFPSPWTRKMFLQELKHNISFCVVARTYQKIVIGYAVAWFIADELHIANIAVHSEYRREGVGTRLLNFLFDEASSRGIKIVTLEVRVSNFAAISLYQKFGFRKIAIRKNYYYDSKEDAIVMLKNLTEQITNKGSKEK